MRNIYFIICILLSAGTIGFLSPLFDFNFNSSSSGSTSYAVEIAKYKYPVYTDYFENLNDVTEINGDDGDFHYISGITKSKQQAEQLSEQLKDLGYSEARVIDLLEEFNQDNLEGIIDIKPQDKEVQKKENAETVISKLIYSEDEQFYTICLKISQDMLSANQFLPLQPKAHKQDDNFYYVIGKFDNAESAQKYLRNNLPKDYTTASIVQMDKGVLTQPQIAESKSATVSPANNMGRKMRGKEYIDYYYELSGMNLARTPVYYIELGPYNDKAKIEEAIQKLHDLGFENAGIKDPARDKRSLSKPAEAADAHYTIQIFAGKNAVNKERFTIEGITQSYDQHDKLYRYFVGDYDNYWVCRRHLRDIRNKGFRDAFIVKL